jgi:hypothetical protein
LSFVVMTRYNSPNFHDCFHVRACFRNYLCARRRGSSKRTKACEVEGSQYLVKLPAFHSSKASKARGDGA